MSDQRAMMRLGEGNDGFVFSISTAAYSELERSTAYEWSAHEVVNGEQVLQFTGEGAESITLNGAIYPAAWYSEKGFSQMPKLRAMASSGKSYLLVVASSLGQNWGYWVIENIREKTSSHLANGLPQKIEFTLSLKRASKSKQS